MPAGDFLSLIRNYLARKSLSADNQLGVAAAREQARTFSEIPSCLFLVSPLQGDFEAPCYEQGYKSKWLHLKVPKVY